MQNATDKLADELRLRVAIDRQVWKRVASFKDSGRDERHFVLEVDQRGNAVISFGDGEHGRRPPVGADVSVNYRFGAGSEGDKRKRRRYIRLSRG